MRHGRREVLALWDFARNIRASILKLRVRTKPKNWLDKYALHYLHLLAEPTIISGSGHENWKSIWRRSALKRKISRLLHHYPVKGLNDILCATDAIWLIKPASTSGKTVPNEAQD